MILRMILIIGHMAAAGYVTGLGPGVVLGREILYATTSWKQFLRLQMCSNCDKSFYTPPPLGGGSGGV